jgi:hypothetical protein
LQATAQDQLGTAAHAAQPGAIGAQGEEAGLAPQFSDPLVQVQVVAPGGFHLLALAGHPQGKHGQVHVLLGHAAELADGFLGGKPAIDIHEALAFHYHGLAQAHAQVHRFPGDIERHETAFHHFDAALAVGHVQFQVVLVQGGGIAQVIAVGTPGVDGGEHQVVTPTRDAQGPGGEAHAVLAHGVTAGVVGEQGKLVGTRLGRFQLHVGEPRAFARPHPRRATARHGGG